jgi:hypothetical protein
VYVVELAAGLCAASVAACLKWWAYLRYLEHAPDRMEAAKAASLYPHRDSTLADVAKVLLTKCKGAG